MNTNELNFVEKIKDHPFNYDKKLLNALKLNVVSQVSRPMLNELAEIYMLVNPSYNIKMLNISCASCVLTFLKDLANIYFRLAAEYEANEVINLNTIEPTIIVEPNDSPITIVGDVVTEDILGEDLDVISTVEIADEEDSTPTIKKRGRPFKTQQ